MRRSGSRSARQRRSRFRSDRLRRFAEPLEDRRLLAFVEWDAGGGDSAWENRLNWTGDVLPGPQDDVQIHAGPEILHSSPDAVSINSLSSNAPIRFTSGSLTLAAESFVGGDFTLSGSASLNGAGSLFSSGRFQWLGGTMAGPGRTIIVGGGRLEVIGSAAKTLDGRTVDNQGVVAWSEAGSVVHANGASWNNEVGGIFELQSSTSLVGNGGAVGAVANAGTLRKTTVGEAYIGIPVHNSGTLNVEQGMLIVASPVSNSGNVSVSASSILAIGPNGADYVQTGGATEVLGTLIVENGVHLSAGILSGSGNIQSDVTNAATIQPGAGVGQLSITGNYQQTPDGRLESEISGAENGQFDRLAVTGNASLGGSLVVTTTGNFLPSAGQVFDVVTFATNDGQFAGDSFPALDGGQIMRADVGSAKVSLVVISPGVVVSPTTLTTSESGAAAQFEIRLKTRPAADVLVPVAVGDLTEGVASTTQVVLTPDDWNQPHFVTVTGLDDDLLDGDVTFSVVLGPANSDDANYAGLDPADVQITNLDEDTTDLVVENLHVETGGSVQSGRELTIRWSDRNRGTVPLGDWSDRVVVMNLTSGQVLWDELHRHEVAVHGALAAGAAWPWERVVQLPDGEAGTGEFEVRVITDVLGEITEQNDDDTGEVNNESVAIANVAAASDILGRYVFYNNSAFDDPSLGRNDDMAIATDKQALLPGQTATFSNYTSYNRGINGIIIDLTAQPSLPTAGDFSLRVGNSNTPSGWATFATLPSVDVRVAAGVEGSNRVTLVWPDGAIRNTWLQVTIAASATTGLATPDVFYFGNAVGESGNEPNTARVSILDELLARNNLRPASVSIPVTDRFDYNRDGRATVVDTLLARNNITIQATELKFISVPAVEASGLVAQGLLDNRSSGAGENQQAIPRTGKSGPAPTASPMSQTIRKLDYIDAIFLQLGSGEADRSLPRSAKQASTIASGVFDCRVSANRL